MTPTLVGLGYQRILCLFNGTILAQQYIFHFCITIQSCLFFMYIRYVFILFFFIYVFNNLKIMGYCIPFYCLFCLHFTLPTIVQSLDA